MFLSCWNPLSMLAPSKIFSYSNPNHSPFPQANSMPGSPPQSKSLLDTHPQPVSISGQPGLSHQPTNSPHTPWTEIESGWQSLPSPVRPFYFMNLFCPLEIILVSHVPNWLRLQESECYWTHPASTLKQLIRGWSVGEMCRRLWCLRTRCRG